jgi:hypothetical protein
MSTVLYAYVLTSDTGFAPCVDGGLFSLACCKPEIRSAAAKDFEAGHDVWILGFCGKGLAEYLNKINQERKLIYIAHLTDTKEAVDYYYSQNNNNCNRKDANAYEVINGQIVDRPRYNPHSGDTKLVARDMRGKVLISDDFKYWGASKATISMDDIIAACGQTTEGVIQNMPANANLGVEKKAGLYDRQSRVGHRVNRDFQGLDDLKQVCGFGSGAQIVGDPSGGYCGLCCADTEGESEGL